MIRKILAKKVLTIPAKHRSYITDIRMEQRHIMTSWGILHLAGASHISLDSIYLYMPLHTLNSTGEKL